ncbi:MAG: hypothetical protein EAZ85_06520 [Bacteroidetes bacterium]|nr:MAG: hypothetical protein EAZ85_06520 [Bacteroidota bacterium]TAG90485.1 MAG: hypothetical protein EAZ20_04200 [Bacteroidota bacterium]
MQSSIFIFYCVQNIHQHLSILHKPPNILHKAIIIRFITILKISILFIQCIFNVATFEYIFFY